MLHNPGAHPELRVLGGQRCRARTFPGEAGPALSGAKLADLEAAISEFGGLAELLAETEPAADFTEFDSAFSARAAAERRAGYPDRGTAKGRRAGRAQLSGYPRATGPSVSEQPAEPLVTIYLTNAVRTSQGPRPGIKNLPASEASALVGMKYAVPGTRNPEAADPEPVVKPFPHVPGRRVAQST